MTADSIKSPLIQIVITDDHLMVINGLQYMLSTAKHMSVTNTYTSGQALLDGLKKFQPDVLLLDVMLGDTTAEQLLPIITKTYPSIRILIVTSIDNIQRVRSLTKAGCLGYVLKSVSPMELILAIETVYRGLPFIAAELKEGLFQSMLLSKRQMPVQGSLLTRREHEVLVEIANGLSGKEIADKLNISANTVETHKRNLFLKLDVKNAVSLIKKATMLDILKH